VNPLLKKILQYVLILGATGALLWVSLRGLQVGDGESKGAFIWSMWQRSDKLYLFAMFILYMISNVARAERWRMLLRPSGNQVSLSASFLSVLVGYLINLVVPRGGEVSRCYNLYKLDRAPVEVSFGTVVVERIIDVVCLLLLVALSFYVEWDKLKLFLDSLGIFTTNENSTFHVPLWAYAALAGMVLVVALWFVFRKNDKLQKVLSGFKEGLFSVGRLERPWLFVFYSVLIWFLYFSMSYCVVEAFAETRGLGVGAVLTIFAVGSIAMAVPLPGGTGSYHTLVPPALVMLYHVKLSSATALVFIFHAWQTLIIIAVGLISFIISTILIQWRARQSK